jgi:hypothetical protein
MKGMWEFKLPAHGAKSHELGRCSTGLVHCMIEVGLLSSKLLGGHSFTKEVLTMNAMDKSPRRLFYLEWIVLNAIAVGIAWYVAWALISLIESVIGGTIQVGGQVRITEDFLFLYVLFPIIGLSTGIIQFILLRRYVPRLAGWIAATFLGWLLPFVIGFIVTRLFVPGNSTLWIVLGMLLVGTTIALPQWWVLRQRVLRASWWVLAHGLGWGLVGLLNLVSSEPFPVLMGIAVVPAIGTSIACWQLLGRLPEYDLDAHASSRGA